MEEISGSVSDKFALDELCNFERSRMCASIEVSKGCSGVSTPRVPEPAESPNMASFTVGKNACQAFNNEWNSEIPCKSSGTVISDSMPRSPTTPGTSLHYAPSVAQSFMSEGTSATLGYSGSTVSGDDSDDCDSHRSRKPGSSLVDGLKFEETLPGLCLQENVVLLINAGGSQITHTPFGVEFVEDCHYEGGDVLCTAEDIKNTKTQALYQTARYGNFSYNILDLPPGDYMVDLHFAEIIFTNGPPGLRVFDVLIQNEKVVSKLDVFSRVGSNTPLILMNANAVVRENGLSITFRGVVGSPTLNGICIRKATSNGMLQSSIRLNTIEEAEVKVQNEESDIAKNTFLPAESESILVREHATLPVKSRVSFDYSKKEKMKRKSKPRKCDELKIQELRNEAHQAWMYVQDANREKEKLQNELDCKSLQVDSLAQAVERQLIDLKEAQDKHDSDKIQWKTSLIELATKLQLIKHEYKILAKNAHEWVDSFPAIGCMTVKIQELVNELNELKKKYGKQGQELKLYYNQVLELKGNIRVFCRCRPLSSSDINVGASSVVDFDSSRDNELAVRCNGGRKLFKFDRVFTPSNNQTDVFADTAPVVVSVLDGYNVCIFAYGQTGTGKTHTMEGTENDRGVNYRTLEELFRLASERKGQFEYTISVSVLEVYNEQIRDLLASPPPSGQSAKKLEIKQVADGVHHVPGLTEAKVESMEEVWEVLQTGKSARAVGSTNCNEHSSRSHCMLCVMVKGESVITGECYRSKLWLVDLAGSERIAKSDVQGDRLKEAQNINKSLSALGDVIYALSTKSSHVPYRNSKLTHLLQDSLGGESKTLMFVQISPSENDAGETLCSLNFASRVRGIELGPAKKQVDSTEVLKYKQMVEKIKQDGKAKDENMKKQEDSMKKLEESLKSKDQASRVLSEKIKENETIIANERKARAGVEHKLKEQLALIEKLREELKAKESNNHMAEVCAQRKILEPVSEVLPPRRPMVENNIKENAYDNFEYSMTENDETDTEIKPPAKNLLTRKPGRASLSVAPRRRPSIAVVIPLPKLDGLDSLRSSAESLQDSFPDENQLPQLQKTVAPSLDSPKSNGWKKGTAIAPSTVLRRSIPRKIHFKSPHLQPTYKSPFVPPVPAADKVSNTQKKREHPGEADKPGSNSRMRRVSIASTWGKPPPQQPWNAGPAVEHVGGAQRVVVANAGTVTKTKAVMYNRERAWNR
uniref:Kinesin 14-IIIa protein n=1 Tax=Marsilea vestita TaxID=59764 RepID=A0A142KWD1_MARVE|nr:kinesin 14-IIIa protein [Marsilea vestita]